MSKVRLYLHDFIYSQLSYEINISLFHFIDDITDTARWKLYVKCPTADEW